jgi:hypothetical protein
MEELDKLNEALKQIQNELRGMNEPWLVGGSCGLLLHGVPLSTAPRDVDLYADDCGAAQIHNRLAAFSTDTPIEDQSGIYRSILSHYAICGIKIELVGGFEVRAHDCVYKVDAPLLYDKFAPEVAVSFQSDQDVASGHETAGTTGALKIMPLEHELLFNILRNRPDRYEPIAEAVRSRMAGMTPVLQSLIKRNIFSDKVLQQLQTLLRHDKQN